MDNSAASCRLLWVKLIHRNPSCQVISGPQKDNKNEVNADERLEKIRGQAGCLSSKAARAFSKADNPLAWYSTNSRR